MNSLNTTQLTSQFEQALIYASQVHAAQRRKVRNTPYIAHLLSVAALVLEDDGSETEAIAALLHDAVEDQGVSLLEIERRFGADVAAIVQGCTEPMRLPHQTWQQHKLQYLKQIQQSSPAVQRVTLADKLHNGRSLWVNLQLFGVTIWRYFSGSREEICWLQTAQLQVFRSVSQSWMVEELSKITEQIINYES